MLKGKLAERIKDTHFKQEFFDWEEEGLLLNPIMYEEI